MYKLMRIILYVRNDDKLLYEGYNEKILRY